MVEGAIHLYHIRIHDKRNILILFDNRIDEITECCIIGFGVINHHVGVRDLHNTHRTTYVRIFLDGKFGVFNRRSFVHVIYTNFCIDRNRFSILIS